MAENNNHKNKIITIDIFCELLCILAAGVFVLTYMLMTRKELSPAVGYAIIAIFGVCAVGYRRRKENARMEESDSENGGNRYWLWFAMAMALSLICTFLPVECWPFVPVFVLLSIYGGVVLGITSSVVLLMIPALLTGQASAFLIYAVCGIVAVTFFCPLERDMKIGIPLIVTLSCLLVLETAGFVMPAENRPTWEMFLMPFVNLVISTVMLLGIVRLYSRRILYRYRDRYLEINDTENPVMSKLREEDRIRYKTSIHVTHFCEILARKLDYDVEALKCAGYYHVFGEEAREIMKEREFPPEAAQILEEYLAVKKADRRGILKTKETAVLVCSDTVVSSILQLLEKDAAKKYNYDKIIDMIFERFRKFGMFTDCDIPVRDLEQIQKTFKGEKLYYDFLH